MTGVSFFDFSHGQTGLAKNCIELHPELAFALLVSDRLHSSGPALAFPCDTMRPRFGLPEGFARVMTPSRLPPMCDRDQQARGP